MALPTPTLCQDTLVQAVSRDGNGLSGARIVHQFHRFMRKGGPSSLTEPVTEPMKTLSASSRQDVPTKLVAQGCPLAPLPLLLVTETLDRSPAPSPLHTTVLTPSPSSQPNEVCSTQSHCSSQPTLRPYPCCRALPSCLSELSVQQLGLEYWRIPSSTAVPARR